MLRYGVRSEIGDALTGSGAMRPTTSIKALLRRLADPAVLFVLSAASLAIGGAFATGFAVAENKWWPAPQINRAVATVGRFLETGQFAPENLIIAAPGGETSTRIRLDAARAPRGWRAVMGYDQSADLYIVWLISATGDVVHSWRVADPSLSRTKRDRDLKMPHGLVILEDGSIAVNSVTDSKFMARYDRCSRELWRKDDFYHHSLHLDDDGSIWTWLSVGSAYSQEQVIERIDPVTGSALERISMRDDIVRPHAANRGVLNVPSYFLSGEPRSWENRRPDIFHTNDVEPLSKALAPKFPMFQEGDLLVSLRNMNLVAVIDRRSHEIKWSVRGPWMHQHDPDFTESGRISVYNNNFVSDKNPGLYQKRSNIITVDPATGQFQILLDEDGPYYYSARMGRHEWITPNIVQVVIPGEGRVIEVDARTDDIVFEFNNKLSPQFNGHVANAEWLPEEYFDEDPKTWRCDS